MCDNILHSVTLYLAFCATFQVFLLSTAKGCRLKINILKTFKSF